MSQTAPAPEEEDDADPTQDIAAHSSSPERTVFTESGNPDGWIATDTTVDTEP
jgi:hypothetical protein